jgi:hypothetical protein
MKIPIKYDLFRIFVSLICEVWEKILIINLDMQNYFIDGEKYHFLGKQSHPDLPKLCLKGVKGIEKSSMHRSL